MANENDELNIENMMAKMPPPTEGEEAEFKRIHARVYAPYDGVLGRLPDWVPIFHQEDFRRVREKLLNTVIDGEPITPEQIIAWMDSHFFPIKLHQDIGKLSFYRNVVELGMEKGLVLLAGENALAGLLSQQGHKKRVKYQAKLEFQKVAAPLFKANGYNINRTINEPELAEFKRKHYGEHTLRNWLKEIRPDDMMLKGRPKKT